MRRTIKRITLTTEQEIYVRANWKNMTDTEMAKRLNIQAAKIFQNRMLMGLQKNVLKDRIIEIPVCKRGFFCVDKYYEIAII